MLKKKYIGFSIPPCINSILFKFPSRSYSTSQCDCLTSKKKNKVRSGIDQKNMISNIVTCDSNMVCKLSLKNAT